MASFFTRKILPPILVAAALIAAPKGAHAQAEAPHQTPTTSEHLLPQDPSRTINWFKLNAGSISNRIGHEIIILDLRETEAFSKDPKAVASWLRHKFEENGFDLKQLGKELFKQAHLKDIKSPEDSMKGYFYSISAQIAAGNGNHTAYIHDKNVVLAGQKTSVYYDLGNKRYHFTLDEGTSGAHEFYHAIEKDGLTRFGASEESTSNLLPRHYKEARGDVYATLFNAKNNHPEKTEELLDLRRTAFLSGIDQAPKKNSTQRPDLPIAQIAYDTTDAIRHAQQFTQNVASKNWGLVQKEVSEAFDVYYDNAKNWDTNSWKQDKARDIQATMDNLKTRGLPGLPEDLTEKLTAGIANKSGLTYPQMEIMAYLFEGMAKRKGGIVSPEDAVAVAQQALHKASLDRNSLTFSQSILDTKNIVDAFTNDQETFLRDHLSKLYQEHGLTAKDFTPLSDQTEARLPAKQAKASTTAQLTEG